MKTTTRKIIPLILLLPGLLPWIFILVFQVREQQIRHRMKEKLETTFTLHTVTLPDHAIVWVKKGREIWVHGKMFDIRTMSRENGKTRFTGLYDEEETVLKKQWQEGWQKQTDRDTNTLTQFFSLQLMNPGDSPNETPAWFLPGEIYTFYHPGSLPQPFRPIITPPPRITC